MKLNSCVLYPGEWLQICPMLCDQEYFNLRFQHISSHAEDVLDLEIHRLETGGFKLKTQVNMAITDPKVLNGWIPRRVVAEVHETWFLDYDKITDPDYLAALPLIEGAVRINIKGLPASVTGKWQLTRVAEGVERSADLDLQVNVPLMGASIEKKLAYLFPFYEEMEAECREKYLQAQFTKAAAPEKTAVPEEQ